MIGTFEPSADPPEGPIGLPSGKPLLGYHFANILWDILGRKGVSKWRQSQLTTAVR